LKLFSNLISPYARIYNQYYLKVVNLISLDCDTNFAKLLYFSCVYPSNLLREFLLRFDHIYLKIKSLEITLCPLSLAKSLKSQKASLFQNHNCKINKVQSCNYRCNMRPNYTLFHPKLKKQCKFMVKLNDY